MHQAGAMTGEGPLNPVWCWSENIFLRKFGSVRPLGQII